MHRPTILLRPTVSLVKVTGNCTCCPIPRPMTQTAKGWQHNDDRSPAHVFHVHETVEHRDCDGLYTSQTTHQLASWWVLETGPLTTADDLWQLLFTHTVAADQVGMLTLNGKDRELHLSEDTDEGYRYVDLHGCEDARCAHEGSLARDHSAEAAGY